MVRYGFRARSSLFVPTGHLYSVLKACLKRDFTASEQWNRERLYFFPLRANNRGPFKIDKCFPRWRTTSVSSSFFPYDAFPYDAFPYDAFVYDAFPYDAFVYDTFPYDAFLNDAFLYDAFPYDAFPYTMPLRILMLFAFSSFLLVKFDLGLGLGLRLIVLPFL